MKVVFAFLLVLVQFEAFSQWAIPVQMRAENTLDRLSDKGGLSNSDILYGVPMPPGNVIGDNYLDKKWNKANILLYQSEAVIEGYPVKYDVKSDLIEIKTNAGIKILDVKKIKNIVWVDSVSSAPHYFVNAGEFKKEGVPSKGLVEVLVDGTLPLVKKTELFVKKPTYNAALDVGTRDTKIYPKETIYFVKDGEMLKVKGKKDVMGAAGDRANEIESFIKSNKLNVNKEADLKKVFEFLNSKQP